MQSVLLTLSYSLTRPCCVNRCVKFMIGCAADRIQPLIHCYVIPVTVFLLGILPSPPGEWMRHLTSVYVTVIDAYARDNQPTNDQRRRDTAYLNKRLFY